MNNLSISIAKPHTIKKFELIAKYVEEWAYKILQCKECKGLVFIDCMCNAGMYYDINKNLIPGTDILVVKVLNSIMKNYQDKKAIIYFNDINTNKVETLKFFIKDLDCSNLTICYNVGDANEFLKSLNIHRYSYFNTLMVYDPYEAIIDWEAISPYLNIWGEVIINHMVSDTIRGAQKAKKSAVIAKYQETYQKSIDEIVNLGYDRKKLNNIIIDIIREQTTNSKREHFIASFPFYNRNNGQVYNLIHCCSNIKGLTLFKKIAWKTFGNKSSLKNTHGNQNQLFYDFTDGNIKTEIDENCFYVKDIARYIYEKYNEKKEISLKEIYFDLDRHPVFPSEGFKKEIKSELKSTYGVTFKTNNIIVFRNEDL